MATAVLARSEKVEQTLAGKRAQGYRVETHDDAQAVLLMRGRRRFMNLRSGHDERYLLTFDEHGDTKSRKIELAD